MVKWSDSKREVLSNDINCEYLQLYSEVISQSKSAQQVVGHPLFGG